MPELQTILTYRVWRASDDEGDLRGPSPSGERKTASTTVVRGPVPRDRWIARTIFETRRALLPGETEPYGERETVSTTVARGPVPRDRWSARTIFKTRRALLRGGCIETRRSLLPGETDPYGERKTASTTVARGPSDATRASERVSPASVGVRGRYRDQEDSPTGKTLIYETLNKFQTRGGRTRENLASLHHQSTERLIPFCG